MTMMVMVMMMTMMTMMTMMIVMMMPPTDACSSPSLLVNSAISLSFLCTPYVINFINVILWLNHNFNHNHHHVLPSRIANISVHDLLKLLLAPLHLSNHFLEY